MINRIIERLEEERELSYADFDRYIEECSPCLESEYDDTFSRGIERAEKIVREESKNNGWISVSERLPNEDECNRYDKDNPCHRQFMCTIKIGDNDKQVRELYFSPVFGWKYGPSDYNKYVIAWQPLPECFKSNE